MATNDYGSIETPNGVAAWAQANGTEVSTDDFQVHADFHYNHDGTMQTESIETKMTEGGLCGNVADEDGNMVWGSPKITLYSIIGVIVFMFVWFCFRVYLEGRDHREHNNRLRYQSTNLKHGDHQIQ